jgi:probable phosphoglycerate mutase
MTTLYLVRHGETVDNANQIMQGQTQGELNENGIRQAQELSEVWKDRPIDVVIASDLKRSIDTARIIAEPHGLEVITTPLLRERDWGGFTGRFIPDLKNEVWPDDIETLENLLSRAGEFIAYVKETFPGKKVLAVGHGIINKAVQAVYYGKTMSEVQRMMNAEVRVLEL